MKYKYLTYHIVPDYTSYAVIDGCDKTIAGIIEIPSKIEEYPVKVIRSDAFENCDRIIGVKIPDTITKIEEEAFSDCASLKEIVIPNGVTRIEDFAFKNCISLTSIKIGNGVVEIGRYAFESCSKLKEIVVPDNVKELDSGVFFDCTSLSNISLGKNLERIGSYAFYNTAYFNDFDNWDNDVLYLDNCLIAANNLLYDSLKDKYVLKNMPFTIMAEGSYAVKNGTTLIADCAFSPCKSLTDVFIPNSVISIGDGFTFDECTALRSVKLSENISKIGSHMFSFCKSLENITIPNKVNEIDYGAFYNCTSLKKIIIPESVNEIRSDAFEYCESLSYIKIKSSNIRIANDAFWYTAYYEDKSNWENGVLYIDNCLIEVDRNTKGVVEVKEGTCSIAQSAFENCSQIVKVIIPDTVKVIDLRSYSLFLNCNKLKVIEGEFSHDVPNVEFVNKIEELNSIYCRKS